MRASTRASSGLFIKLLADKEERETAAPTRSAVGDCKASSALLYYLAWGQFTLSGGYR